jgi:ribosome-associated toxin RatA of RatAB toxin-antitoxin module
MFRISYVHHTSAGRFSATCRRSFLVAVMVVAGLVSTHAAPNDEEYGVAVSEKAGIYTVSANFVVPEPSHSVLTVLTDYPSIPRFMSQVRTSAVRERSEGHAVVEQEAIARFLMFSKRIHLVLAVEEFPTALHFRDVSGKSFERYEGAWRVEPRADRTRVEYELTAKPAFSVPEFLLQRLLKRDAAQMLKGLQAEIARRHN